MFVEHRWSLLPGCSYRRRQNRFKQQAPSCRSVQAGLPSESLANLSGQLYRRCGGQPVKDPQMIPDWFYGRTTERYFGPVPFVALRQGAWAGKLLPSHVVCKQGWTSWHYASEVMGLFQWPFVPNPPLSPDQKLAKKKDLLALFSQHRREEVQDFASTMYWRGRDHGTVVRDVYGLVYHKKFNANAREFWVQCRYCKEFRLAPSGSWHAVRECWSDCDRCAALERARYEARVEELHQEEQRRLLRLYELKTMPYREYLRSPEWKAKRERKLEQALGRCQVCNREDMTLEVHHRTYERRGNEWDEDLTVLCRDCHTNFHEVIAGRK
jgi:5-methylcytosine-specific restriction endonuclease McrA